MIVLESFYLPYVPNDFPMLPKDYLEPRMKNFINNVSNFSNYLLSQILNHANILPFSHYLLYYFH